MLKKAYVSLVISDTERFSNYSEKLLSRLFALCDLTRKCETTISVVNTHSELKNEQILINIMTHRYFTQHTDLHIKTQSTQSAIFVLAV